MPNFPYFNMKLYSVKKDSGLLVTFLCLVGTVNTLLDSKIWRNKKNIYEKIWRCHLAWVP